MKKGVFIVIVGFNGEKKIVDCLRSIDRLHVTRYTLHVIVVDNNSTDKSLEKIKNEKRKRKNDNLKLKIIKNKKNLGFAGGVNVGVKYALKNGADDVMLLNQDAIVEEGAIEKVVKVMKKDKKIGICGPLIFTPDKKVWSAGGVIDKKRYSGGHLFKMLKKSPYQVDFISGCAMMIKKEVFEKIGFFDERFFLYYEDVDFCLRTKKAGFKSVLIPKAVVDHHYQKSISKQKTKSILWQRVIYCF